MYSTYRWPPGFYHEADTGDPAPYYVNTVSIRPSCCRPSNDWRELSTEDPAQARAWADSSVAYSNGVAPLDPGPPVVTQRFFEFPSTGSRPSGRVAMRVHRLSYLDRSMYNHWSPDSLIGRFNARPIDTLTVRGLVEYLWYKSWHEIGGRKVLSSFGRDDGDAIVHVIYSTTAVYGDYNLCDELSLVREEYRVPTTTGLVERVIVVQRRVGGVCR